MPRRVRFVVVGCGGLGSAAAYWLARDEGEVLALEQFAVGHDNGASQDHSRIIRLSYHSRVYTALTPATYTRARSRRRRGFSSSSRRAGSTSPSAARTGEQSCATTRPR